VEGARLSPWRQGQVLPDEAAIRLGLVKQEQLGQLAAVIISHDCDLANDKEMTVEVIVGRWVAGIGGQFANAKNVRRLHIAFADGEAEHPMELSATDRRSVDKEALYKDFQPRANRKLRPRDLQTLQWWLSARYRRAAFPNQFEERLRDKPAKLREAISAAMEPCKQVVRGIYFLLDDGEDVEREGEDDLYSLGIYLLYDGNQEPEASLLAQKAAEAIEAAFEVLRTQRGWKNIELLFCEAISDSAMTVATERELKEWRLDHLSLEDGEALK